MNWNGLDWYRNATELGVISLTNSPIGILLFRILWDSYRKRGGSVKTSQKVATTAKDLTLVLSEDLVH